MITLDPSDPRAAARKLLWHADSILTGPTGVEVWSTIEGLLRELDTARAKLAALEADRDSTPQRDPLDSWRLKHARERVESQHVLIREIRDALGVEGPFSEIPAQARVVAQVAALASRRCAMTAPSTSTTCIRCLRPEATQEDEDVYQRWLCEPEPPEGWPDHEGSHLCWRVVAKGDCTPAGPSPRVTSGRFVVHDGDFDLLSCSVEEAIEALRAAGYVFSASPSP